MRLSPLPPPDMPSGTRTLHDDMVPVIAAHLKGFVSRRSDGAPVRPFPPMLQFPQFGAAAWAYTKALIEHAMLPKPVREVAIHVTGAHFNSRYELYAHEHVGDSTGLSAAKATTTAAGQPPNDLSPEEAVAHDVAAALGDGNQLPGSTYQAAVNAFGKDGAAELVHLIGRDCLVSMLLNAFDVSVPGNEEGVDCWQATHRRTALHGPAALPALITQRR
jgi:4-carboxymuconolactone decarboxylase